MVLLAPPSAVAQRRSRSRLLAAVTAAGPVAVALTALLAVTGRVTGASEAPSSAVVVAALVSLVLGVPHGAVDHLALPRPPRGAARVLLLVGYVALAAVSAAGVLLAPAAGFVAVLAMSVWHFGSGDVEALAELTDGARSPRLRPLRIAAAGAVPVLLPLTSPAAVATVSALDPRLAAVLSPHVTGPVRAATLAVAAAAVLALAVDRQVRAAVELVLLSGLALLVTPLLAFAVYFAPWHALRHTARLVLDDRGTVDHARLRRVVLEGLPPLVVASVLVVAGLAVAGHATGVLWVGLAAVWGLTVPHMVVVGAFDRRRRSAAARSVGVVG